MIATICTSILKKTKPNLVYYNAVKKISTKECKEVEINVPWGKITGKYWGSNDIQPIIAIHGWQDNAATFDPLIKFLPNNISVLAIDLPGHGFSSWIPDGLMYNILLYSQAIERVKLHYGMEKIGLIGHSMGGMTSFYYASSFPNTVKFVVALDYYKFPSYNDAKHRPIFMKEWEKFFTFEKKKSSAPRYTVADAIEKSIIGARKSLNESTCKILYTRGTIKHPDGTISFIRDPRVKHFGLDYGFTHDFLKLSASFINAPYRILKAEDCGFNEKKELYYDVMKVIEKNSKDFKFHTVPGGHHFHMDIPRDVANIINPFIIKYY